MKRTHGESPQNGRKCTKEYGIWAMMRQRCRNKKNKNYPTYGGRGIRICERWNAYENFLADMKRAPGKKFELDRVDNDGPYSPENCRWATRTDQTRNSSSNKLTIEKAAEIRKKYSSGLTMQKIADQFGVSAVMIGRIVNGKNWK